MSNSMVRRQWSKNRLAGVAPTGRTAQQFGIAQSTNPFERKSRAGKHRGQKGGTQEYGKSNGSFGHKIRAVSARQLKGLDAHRLALSPPGTAFGRKHPGNRCGTVGAGTALNFILSKLVPVALNK